MSAIRISFTTSAEEPACIALLPETGGVPCELLIARRGDELVGAAALVWESWSDPAGFPCAVHVLPFARRQGIGRALMMHLAGLVRGETHGLWSLRALSPTSDAAGFLAACGFIERRRQIYYAVPILAFDAQMTRIADRLSRHGRVPANARTISLREAPLDEVALLVAREFRTAPLPFLAQLRAGLANHDDHALDYDRSTVTMEGDQVAGALLYRWNDGDVAIDVNVVAPAWRNSYVNALQLAVATRRAVEGGATRFRFHCDATVRDSMNLAIRGGAEQIAEDVLFYYAVAS